MEEIEGLDAAEAAEVGAAVEGDGDGPLLVLCFLF